MKYIREYQIFEASASAPQTLTAEQIEWLDECVDGSWKLNRQTGLIDVDGDFDCYIQGLRDLRGIRFGKVSGDFDCHNNQLTTLVGAPQTVDGSFDCSSNQLTTLEGAPKTVGWGFLCYNNQLTTLVGAPQSVGGDFYCADNQLTTLEGAPQTVGGDFYCSYNQLTSLVGAPKSYQQALEERWPKMGDEDRALMYKEMPSLSPEDARKYKALTTYNNIKDYL